MNILIIYLIFCSYSILLSRSYGRKTHVRNIIFDRSTKGYSDNSKYKLKKILGSFSENNNIVSPSQNQHLFKLNVDVPKKFHPNPAVSNKNSIYPASNFDSSDKYKTLSMEVGKHLVKVKSALESKKLELAPKEEGYEISVNPKFSHIIEIIHREDTNFEKEHKPTETEGQKKLIEKHNLGLIKTDDTLGTDEVVTDDDTLGTDEVVTDDDTLETDEVVTDDDTLETDEVVTEDDTLETDEVITTDDTLDTDEVITIDDTQDPNVIVTTDDTLGTRGTNIELRDKTGGEESAFNGELEGSGEEFTNSEDSENDQGTSKSGRILGIFSRQNETSPACTTPKGEAGQCRRIRQCLLSDALNNFNVFLQHLCLIRGALVGMCCPDNPVIEISDPDENTTKSISEEIKQPPEGCGSNTKTRIVGGTISGPNEWTWMVALMRRSRFYCGGVIINNWYILTAAHCVLGIDVKDLTVRLGEYDFNAVSKHKEDISVSEIKRHAQFVTLTFQHDIALLKLKQSISYSKFVGSICLPSQKARDYSDVKGTVVGWGTVSFGGAASPILRQVTVPVWKNEDCDRTYLLENISDSFMCAGSPEKGEDACQGDSGGPLMAVNEIGRWEVIGIVSWGRRCGDPTYPGVYTRVTTYLDWINQNAN